MSYFDESELLKKINYHKKQSKKLCDELHKKRKARAEDMRVLYFKKRMKQTEIAKMYKMRQGSVSRIISELSCYK